MHYRAWSKDIYKSYKAFWKAIQVTKFYQYNSKTFWNEFFRIDFEQPIKLPIIFALFELPIFYFFIPFAVECIRIS